MKVGRAAPGAKGVERGRLDALWGPNAALADVTVRAPGLSSGRRGFTLVELILVMGMLVIVLSLAAPSLGRFFRGRSLDSEARRFVSLTRYAQSRAVSEGIPMVVWIDPREGAYGLEAEPSYDEADSRAVEFTVGDDLELEVELPERASHSGGRNQPARLAAEVAEIRFTPDGFVSEESPEFVVMRQGDAGEIWIGLSRNRLYYEIQTNSPPVSLR